jgi:hypothetical protein
MEWKKLIPPKRSERVGTSIIICKLHFKDVRAKRFDDRAHLTASQVMLRHILCERNDVQHAERICGG